MVRAGAPRRLGGFTYLGVLFAVALASIGLATGGLLWHTAQKREKERELLFIGQQFRAAIGSYHEKTPGLAKQFPKSLEELVLDRRYLTPQRHLRRIYRDPFTGEASWGLVKAPDGGIMGVYSLAPGTPLKTGNFDEEDKAFEGKASYAEWRFIYLAGIAN